jgi:hypothetical protein
LAAISEFTAIVTAALGANANANATLGAAVPPPAPVAVPHSHSQQSIHQRTESIRATLARKGAFVGHLPLPGVEQDWDFYTRIGVAFGPNMCFCWYPWNVWIIRYEVSFVGVR